ncbi:MAG: prepilin-type N-terminal cleavage/methylation domain-containing protein [Actinomycetota bacterium]
MRIARPDDGYTLIEVMTAISLGAILMAVSTWSFVRYNRATSQSGTAIELRSLFRNVGERALSEGRTYCVYINDGSDSWSTYKSDCTVAANKVDGPKKPDNGTVAITSVSFGVAAPAIANQTRACPVANACAYFYPRGNALAGTVSVTRSGTSKTYTISIEGLTARVSMV